MELEQTGLTHLESFIAYISTLPNRESTSLKEGIELFLGKQKLLV